MMMLNMENENEKLHIPSIKSGGGWRLNSMNRDLDLDSFTELVVDSNQICMTFYYSIGSLIQVLGLIFQRI